MVVSRSQPGAISCGPTWATSASAADGLVEALGFGPGGGGRCAREDHEASALAAQLGGLVGLGYPILTVALYASRSGSCARCRSRWGMTLVDAGDDLVLEKALRRLP